MAKNKKLRLISKHVAVAENPEYTSTRRQPVNNLGKPNKSKKSVTLTIGLKDKYGNDKYAAVGLRFNNFYERLRKLGYSIDLSKTLARILTQLSVAEKGYTMKASNFTGMNGGAGKANIYFEDPWQAHIDNLNDKFGDKNPYGRWDKATDINSYIESINAGDRFTTEQLWNNEVKRIKKLDKDFEPYLYNPRWENAKPYKELLYDVHTPVNGFIDLLLLNNKYTFNNLFNNSNV